MALNWEKESNRNEDQPAQLVKRVQIIKNCSCSSCGRDASKKGDSSNPQRDLLEKHIFSGAHGTEMTDDLQLPQNDVPDLLNVLHQRNETNTTISSEHNENVKNLMNNKIISLLQNIQEKNSQYDKYQLMELLRMVQASTVRSNSSSTDDNKGESQEEQLSDSMIAEFVESLSAEHIELDVPKLKEILIKYEHSKLLEKSAIQKTNLSPEYLLEKVDEHNNDDNSDGESPVLGITGGLEGSHHGLGHLKGSHIGAGIHNLIYDSTFSNAQADKAKDDLYLNGEEHRLPVIDHNDINEKTVHEHRPHHYHHHHAHHHHKHLDGGIHSHDDANAPQEQHSKEHLNQYHHVDESFGDGHLVKGPRGALVIRPDSMFDGTGDQHALLNDTETARHNHDNAAVYETKVGKSKQHEHEVHEKINVSPHDLKLNHAGTMVSYGGSTSDLSSSGSGDSSSGSSSLGSSNAGNGDNISNAGGTKSINTNLHEHDTLLLTNDKISDN